MARLLRGPLDALLKQGRIPFGLQSLRQSMRDYAVTHNYQSILNSYPSALVVVIENTRDHSGMIRVAKANGRKVICVPHDIESLSSGRCKHDAPFQQMNALHKELSELGHSDAVFTISHEEQWLLRGFGIEADNLPSFPDSRTQHDSLIIRSNRQQSPKSHILVFGSAMHPPTREGMAEVIQWLADWNDRPLPVVVAGFGTETLNSLIPADGFQLVGSISPTDLTTLLNKTFVAVAHQRFGCGALTRIPNLLIAGIPVVANRIAARSYHGMSGVHVYDDASQLFILLKSQLEVPDLPLKPVDAEHRFIKRVKELASR